MMQAQIVGLLLISLLAPKGEPNIPFGGTDFKQYYTTSRLILKGQNPYDYDKAGDLQQSLGYQGEPQVPYGPPTSLLPFIPLGWVSFPIAIQMQLVLNLTMLMVSCYIWGKFFLQRYALLALMMIAFWVPTWTLLGLGQVSPWLLFGFSLWHWGMKQQRPVLAGMALTCTIIKPHLAFGLVLYALLLGIRQKQWRMIASFFGTMAVLIVLSFIIRPTIWMEYLGSLERSNPGQWFNATLDGWGRLTFGPRFSFFSGAWCLLLLQGIVVLAWYRPVVNECSVLVLALWLAATPYAFTYDYSMLLPALIMTLGHVLHRSHPHALVAALGWILLSYTAYHFKGPWKEYQFFFIPTCGLALTLLLVSRPAEEATATTAPA
jgi:hypothetical protein